MPTETRYHRSDQHVVNSLTARKLLTTRSGVAGNMFINFAGNPQYWVADVFVRSTTATEVQIGSNVAEVSRFNPTIGITQGMQAATWTCPETTLVTTDAVRVNEKGVGPPPGYAVQIIDSFITEQLGAVLLSNVVWTFNRYTYLDFDPGEGNIALLYYDTATYNTRIENFTWNLPGGPPTNNLFFCNG